MKKILLLTDFSSGYSRSLLTGIVNYSKDFGPWAFYRMPLYYREVHGEKIVVEWAKKWKADAIVAQLRDIDMDTLLESEIPIIIQNYKNRHNQVSNITGDYFATGVMAADFFLKRGFYHFAFYGYEDTIWSRERAAGYKQTVEEHGYTLHFLNNNNVHDEQWSFNPLILSEWLLSLPKPIALFACDDYFALQITETCKMYNINIPNEISVLGVDNDELLCNISDPPLSSIVLDVENGGYKAGKLLHMLMNKEISQAQDIVINPVRIEYRESTEKYAIKDHHIEKVLQFVEDNYSKHLSISEIMKKVPLSRRVLEKKFKKELGMPIYQYVQSFRVEKFTELLLKSNLPLPEIAMLCGFEEYKNVSRVFVKRKQMTPLQYRNKYNNRSLRKKE